MRFSNLDVLRPATMKKKSGFWLASGCFRSDGTKLSLRFGNCAGEMLIEQGRTNGFVFGSYARAATNFFRVKDDLRRRTSRYSAMSMSVTSRADARLAPAIAMADL
jgi:hypothetical protein